MVQCFDTEPDGNRYIGEISIRCVERISENILDASRLSAQPVYESEVRQVGDPQSTFFDVVVISTWPFGLVTTLIVFVVVHLE